jgi:hypothetical protein
VLRLCASELEKWALREVREGSEEEELDDRSDEVVLVFVSEGLHLLGVGLERASRVKRHQAATASMNSRELRRVLVPDCLFSMGSISLTDAFTSCVFRSCCFMLSIVEEAGLAVVVCWGGEALASKGTSSMVAML